MALRINFFLIIFKVLCSYYCYVIIIIRNGKHMIKTELTKKRKEEKGGENSREKGEKIVGRKGRK